MFHYTRTHCNGIGIENRKQFMLVMVEKLGFIRLGKEFDHVQRSNILRVIKQALSFSRRIMQ